MTDFLMLLAILVTASIGAALGSSVVLAHDRKGGMTYWDRYCRFRMRTASWWSRRVHRNGGQAE